MTAKSKSEISREQKEHEEHTDAEVKESEEVKDDSEEASNDWAEQNVPSLSDTAAELNQIGESLRSDMQEQHGSQADNVENSIDSQRQEVSEPARTGEQNEQDAANELNMASTKNKRFGQFLDEASGQRHDAEMFMKEVAETDEESQEKGRDTLENHRQGVAQSIQGIRDL